MFDDSILHVTLLKSYLKRLTNLTSRNRSLLLLNLPQRQFLDVHDLNFINQKPSYELISQLLEQKKSIKLCEVLDPRFERNNELSQQLKQISKTEKLIEAERGSEDLYVAYPFIKGKLNDGTVLRCPLLFFPVSLKQKNNDWVLEKREAEITLNRSFLLAYSHFNQQSISDDFIETSFEDFPKNSLEFHTYFYEFLKNSPIKINFNQALFSEQLIHFERLTKDFIDQTERNGELKLYPQAVLGIFPQAGSYLVPDYEKLIEKITNYELRTTNDFGSELQKIESDSLHSTRNPLLETKKLNSIKEEALLLPFSVDASQELAIRAVKIGESLVVQGPPGTGKSQLICNLIADFTAARKKVLVVCQKRAALDTVYKRLEQIQLHHFMALVHDFRNDRKEIFEKIATQIEQVENYKKQNLGLDSIFLERNYAQICHRIDHISAELQEFKNALFDESICGKSVKELYLLIDNQQNTIDVSDCFKYFHFNEIANFCRKLKQLEAYQQQLDEESFAYHFWQKRNSIAQRKFSDVKTFAAKMQAIQVWHKSLFANLKAWNFKISDFENIQIENLEYLKQLLDSEEVLRIFNRFFQQKKWKATQLKNSQWEEWKNKLNHLKTIDLQLLQQDNFEANYTMLALEEALDASKSFLKKTSWQLFSKNKNLVFNLLEKHRLKFESIDLQILKHIFEDTLQYKSLVDEFKKFDIDIKLSLAEQTEILANFQKAFVAYQYCKTHVKECMASVLTSQTKLLDFQNVIGHIVQVKKDKQIHFSEWQQWFSEEQIQNLIENNIQDLVQYLEKNIDFLIEIDQLQQDFSHTESVIATKLMAEKYAHFDFVFTQSLYRSWIDEIEQRHPILRGVDTLKMSQLEEELQNCVQQKQALSEQIVLIKLRENTYKDLQINRLNNVVSYRELLHQVSKKKRVWTIRKLIENYKEELFKLIPCWLASPESVSALFPLSPDFKDFDLVIFDEASQCFVEHGIPALVRGKQVLVAGDSQQLQPNDLYQVRYEEETDDEPLLEIDALLDLANQCLPQVQLMGHYRSKSLDLIDFSNQHFYKNTLSLLPDFQEINLQKPAIEFLKVAGVWHKNQNEIEAEKVVEVLQKISLKKTIGVVTFNYKQADLIERKLEQIGINSSHVVIKNIENIQGDEFDMVIFSVAYAPDAKGKLLMNFGNLNQSGGENRLNVAITRAKEKVMVVCSIFPEQLQVDNAQNAGPKFLKAYLQYAFDVSEGNYRPKPKEIGGYKSSVSLKDKLLSAQNYKELPFADITVKNGKYYDSLILTDDDLYFSSHSPKETHAYLPLLLKQKGWKFSRLWSRSWLRKPKG